MAYKLSQIASGDSSTEDICETQVASISFAQDGQHNSGGLHQQSKNTVSKDLVTLTRDQWKWCLERNIHIQTQHLPGVLNHRADRESRCMKDRSNWKLDRNKFMRINRHFSPLEVDLFALKLTYQCPHYFSWWPDVYAETTDAFLQDWLTMK